MATLKTSSSFMIHLCILPRVIIVVAVAAVIAGPDDDGDDGHFKAIVDGKDYYKISTEISNNLERAEMELALKSDCKQDSQPSTRDYVPHPSKKYHLRYYQLKQHHLNYKQHRNHHHQDRLHVASKMNNLHSIDRHLPSMTNTTNNTNKINETVILQFIKASVPITSNHIKKFHPMKSSHARYKRWLLSKKTNRHQHKHLQQQNKSNPFNYDDDYEKSHKDSNNSDEIFLNNEDDDQYLPYGHVDRTEGLKKNTVCDWIILVDECEGPCPIMSPSQVILMNHTCTYLFISLEDQRIELEFPDILNPINSNSNNACNTSTVEVYDGFESTERFLERYCVTVDGRVQNETSRNIIHFISRGSSMVLKFNLALPLGKEFRRFFNGYQSTSRHHYHHQYRHHHHHHHHHLKIQHRQLSHHYLQQIRQQIYQQHQHQQQQYNPQHQQQHQQQHHQQQYNTQHQQQHQQQHQPHQQQHHQQHQQQHEQLHQQQQHQPQHKFTENIFSTFIFQALKKWKYSPELADRVEGTDCDWVFNSSQTFSGDFHTPDYFINNATTCKYIFISQSSKEVADVQVILQLNVFYRYRTHENETCNESISLKDGENEIQNFCITEVIENVNQRYSFVHKTNCKVVTVTYTKNVKQISNPEPTWVNYKFRKKIPSTLSSSPNTTAVLSNKETSTDHVKGVSTTSLDHLSCSLFTTSIFICIEFYMYHIMTLGLYS